MAEEKAVVGQVGSVKGGRKRKQKQERSVGEARAHCGFCQNCPLYECEKRRL